MQNSHVLQTMMINLILPFQSCCFENNTTGDIADAFFDITLLQSAETFPDIYSAGQQQLEFLYKKDTSKHFLHFLAPYSLESIQRIIIIIKRMLVSKF
jgi:hypothetical protein